MHVHGLAGVNPSVRISTCGAIFHPYSNFWTIGIFPPKRAVQIGSFLSSGAGFLVLLLTCYDSQCH